MAAADFSAKMVEACEAGEKFVEAFYDVVDKRRTVSNFSSSSLFDFTHPLYFPLFT